MAEKMMGYLKEQPMVWRNLVKNRKQITEAFVKAFKDAAFSQIIVIGSGSSYNAAYVAKQVFADYLGIRFLPVPPSRALEMLPLYTPEDTVVFFVSQSGESTNTIGLLDSIHKKGYRTVGLTQLNTSSVAKKCDVFVHIDCGEETVGPKTKGYSATVLCLYLLCLELSKARGYMDETSYEAAYSLLDSAFSLADENIMASANWAKKHTESFTKAPHMMIVSEGANYPAMLEGALKILECLYIPVTAYEFEEYLHGVQCSIDENSYIIFVFPDVPNRERMLRLYEFHAAHKGKGFAVAVNKTTGIEGELLIKTAGADMASVFSVVLPMQLVSVIVSEAKGINCDTSKFPEFVKALGTKNW